MSRRRLALALFALGASACRLSLEDDFVRPDATTVPDGGVDAPPSTNPACIAAAAEAAPTATFLFTNTVNLGCAGMSCHDATQPEGELDLSSGAKIRAMLDRDARALPSMKLVVAGQPAKSYLMLRINHIAPQDMDPPHPAIPAADASDFYMPQRSSDLCLEKREAIERWILAGAPL